jgi:hypothetical protein
MKYVKQLFVVVLMAAVLSLAPAGRTNVFGQKSDNRPPKERAKAKETDKQPPPRNNNNQGNNNRHGNH